MKICIISSLYKPTIIGGAEVVAEKTARELQRRGHEVFVVTTNHHSKTEEVDVDDIKTYRIPLNIYSIYNLSDQSIIKKLLWHLIDLWNPSAYFKLKDILKEKKPDIIHIHNFKGFSGAAFSAAKKLDVPVVFTVKLITEVYTGFLFEPGDKDELKGVLKRLVEDPSILKEFEKNAYESAKNYTLNEHVDKLEGIYRGLLVDV